MNVLESGTHSVMVYVICSWNKWTDSPSFCYFHYCQIFRKSMDVIKPHATSEIYWGYSQVQWNGELLQTFFFHTFWPLRNVLLEISSESPWQCQTIGDEYTNNLYVYLFSQSILVELGGAFYKNCLRIVRHGVACKNGPCRTFSRLIRCQSS